MWRHCPEPMLWFALGSSDLRGGGCETAFKADLAHNLCLWVKTAWVSQCRRFAPVGILRLVRDVFTISGQVVLDARGHIKQILLNQRDPFAEDFQ